MTSSNSTISGNSGGYAIALILNSVKNTSSNPPTKGSSSDISTPPPVPVVSPSLPACSMFDVTA
jgi:hypothetical protein